MNRLSLVFSLILMTSALAVGQTSQTPPPASQPNSKPTQSSPRKFDRSSSYYHYTLAHMYEEMFTAYGRSDLATKAIDEYRLAIEAYTPSEFVYYGLTELAVKTACTLNLVREAK